MHHSNRSEQGNDHKKTTPSTKGDKGKADDGKFTSYDTSRKETEDPQKVRMEIEPEGQEARLKKSE